MTIEYRCANLKKFKTHLVAKYKTGEIHIGWVKTWVEISLEERLN